MAPADGVHSAASRAPPLVHMFCCPSQGCVVIWLMQVLFARRQLSRDVAALLPPTALPLPLMFPLLLLHLSDALWAAGWPQRSLSNALGIPQCQ